ncbi:VOC family protein [Roseomonas sp. GC11]|uniref:VOC family protein n=1 Tax=Roseomonas sp. GC11 TaxID=2950546 RepID=UPI00210F0039|nr:VOC family protein [Roseomonas sp. GC11]MCQ4161640.1 VOC family protein [Roseomonas sp. GC11]
MALSVTLDHLHLRSTDPDAAARFYVERLGASPVSRGDAGGALRVVVDLAGLRLFIEAVPAGTTQAPPPPFIGLEHLGLAVADLDAALAALEAEGVRRLSGPAQPRPGVRIAFIEGPDATRIELLERSPA